MTSSPRVYSGSAHQRSRSGAAELHRAVDKAGFYPRLVNDVVAEALNGQEPIAHLVHLETHFDRAEVRRHVTVLALTEHVLVVTHVDDHLLDEAGEQIVAQVSNESVALSSIRSVILGYLYAQPQEYTGREVARELTLSIAWTGGQRFDIGPASCGDPQCEADHGMNGNSHLEDIVLRVSAEADGPQAVQRARDFAAMLRAASTGTRVGKHILDATAQAINGVTDAETAPLLPRRRPTLREKLTARTPRP